MPFQATTTRSLGLEFNFNLGIDLDYVIDFKFHRHILKYHQLDNSAYLGSYPMRKNCIRFEGGGG